MTLPDSRNCGKRGKGQNVRKSVLPLLGFIKMVPLIFDIISKPQQQVPHTKKRFARKNDFTKEIEVQKWWDKGGTIKIVWKKGKRPKCPKVNSPPPRIYKNGPTSLYLTSLESPSNRCHIAKKDMPEKMILQKKLKFKNGGTKVGQLKLCGKREKGRNVRKSCWRL